MSPPLSRDLSNKYPIVLANSPSKISISAAIRFLRWHRAYTWRVPLIFATIEAGLNQSHAYYNKTRGSHTHEALGHRT
jgi:hypothetical protein